MKPSRHKIMIHLNNVKKDIQKINNRDFDEYNSLQAMIYINRIRELFEIKT